MTERLTIAIAGAAGFVGKHLVDRLVSQHDVIALGRSVAEGERWAGTEARGRRCDLFSLKDAERALEGVDVAYYLVHSMMPSARLTQAAFEDMDAVLADNFGRAAAQAGVRHIIYLGGLTPETESLSRHLESRAEVESLLGAYGVPVTVLRAGLVIGAGGSSFEILTRLVGRLPVLVCPQWTLSPTQPIALHDVVELLARSAGRAELGGQAFDVGGPDVLSYREMIERTATHMGFRRRILSVQVLTPRLSTLWVSLVTGASRALVGPLVESLRHPMVARDDRLAQQLGVTPIGFDEAVQTALRDERAQASQPTVETPLVPARRRRNRPDVRSIQRLPAYDGLDAHDVTMRYLRWLPRLLRPLLRVHFDDDGVCRFDLALVGICLLALRYSEERSTPDRALLYIVGGALARVDAGERGRLEFRVLPDGRGMLAAIHDFTPSLPWYIYRITQAQVHLWVMRRFARALRHDPAP